MSLTRPLPCPGRAMYLLAFLISFAKLGMSFTCNKAFDSCPKGYALNSLACECFHQKNTKCTFDCASWEYPDPRKPCECLRESKYWALWPAGATKEMIRQSYADMGCFLKDSECGGTLKVNQLACQCMTSKKPTDCTFRCASWEKDDPRNPCDCLSEDKWWKLWPPGTTQSMIDESFEEMNEKDTSKCTLPSTACKPDYAVNKLACQCHSLYQCKKQCRSWEILDPREDCECISKADYWKIWPAGVTEKQIKKSQDDMRRDNQKECTLQNSACREGYAVNKLACECHTLAQCFTSCPSWQMPDPRNSCQCISQQEYWNIWPRGTTALDIEKAEQEMRDSADDRGCSLDGSNCPLGYGVNKLACACHSLALCPYDCPRWQEHDPRTSCECISQQEYWNIWPPGTTTDQILKSQEEMRGSVVDKTCKLDYYDCKQGYTVNELACDCHSLKRCTNRCKIWEKHDPRTDCECMHQQEYWKLWPAGTAIKQIEQSQYLMQQTGNDQCPSRIFYCSPGYAVNKLGCECHSMAQCWLTCPSGQKLDPRTDCECISARDYWKLWPPGTTEDMIDRAAASMVEGLYYSTPPPMDEGFDSFAYAEDSIDARFPGFADFAIAGLQISIACSMALSLTAI